jgi:Uncharacterised nucleotidyltransferase
VAGGPGPFAALDRPARWVVARGLPTGLVAPSEPLGPEDWDHLVATCEHHRTEGLLVAAVASGDLPADAAQLAEAAVLELTMTRTRMIYEPRLVEIVEQLTRWGIEARVLKGCALAHLDYPDPQMRPTGDIDLLVRGDQIDEVVDRLVAEGAVRLDPDPVAGYAGLVGKGATMLLAGGGELDLHRLLVWGPIGVRLPPDELWTTSRSWMLDGHELATLGLEETLIHLCLHLVVGGTVRALSLRDVAQLLVATDLDAERVTGLARRWRVEAAVATAVRLSVRELDVDEALPLVDWAAGYAPGPRDRLWLRVDRPERALPALEPFATWIELPSAEARRMLVRATLRPAPGTWPTPVRRLRRLGARAGRVPRQVIAR